MCKQSDFPLSYLTVRPVKARKGYGSTAHEAKLKLSDRKGNNKVSKCKLRKYLIGNKTDEGGTNFATR